MNKEELEERLINIETALACQEKMVDELNQVIIEQGKLIDRLKARVQYLLDNMEREAAVKPLSEEVPPPHY